MPRVTDYRRDWRDIPLWKDVSPEQWTDWRWQDEHRVTTPEILAEVIELTPEEASWVAGGDRFFPFAVTPHWLSLMDPSERRDPLRLQVIPGQPELQTWGADLVDPLAEDRDSPVPHLVHRYPDRVLFLVTEECQSYCRFCTRRRLVGQELRTPLREEWDASIDYVARTPAVRDVILSGGDPFQLPLEDLDYLLARLRRIEHVEILRCHSRIPSFNPFRVTAELVDVLRSYQPLYVNVHFNHPRELVGEAVEALGRLADGGIPLGNQSVLLRGVNDDSAVQRELCHRLLKARVKPYYLYQADLTARTGHFRTKVARGIEVIEHLRGHTTGMGIPTFVVDGPGGGGKIPVMPNYLISMGEGKVVLRNFEGVISTYTEPGFVDFEPGEGQETSGVAGLFHGRAPRLDVEHGADRRGGWQGRRRQIHRRPPPPSESPAGDGAADR
ncbi:MAG: KamA family radical SAM protein [Actinomycetota bacterium]